MSAPIRNSAKAVIVRDDALLLIRKDDPAGTPYYIFPGGGQAKFEDLRSTLRRECLEEIGCAVQVGDLLWVREYIGRNHEFAAVAADVHQVEFYFACQLAEGVQPGNGPMMDHGQVGVEWVALAEIGSKPIYPLSLRAEFIKPSRVYLGDAN